MNRWKVVERQNGVSLPLDQAAYPNLGSAMERAQFHVLKHRTSYCDVVNRQTGRVRIRYWFDGGRMQYMEF